MKETYYGLSGEKGEGPRLDNHKKNLTIEAVPLVINNHMIADDLSLNEYVDYLRHIERIRTNLLKHLNQTFGFEMY